MGGELQICKLLPGFLRKVMLRFRLAHVRFSSSVDDTQRTNDHNIPGSFIRG